MEHTMNLNAHPFEMMRSGKKTIELRLYDEKRRKISVGDTIRFTNLDDPEQYLITTVVSINVFKSFEELYKALPLLKCGYTAESITNASPMDMREYYTSDQEAENGVCGIQVKVVAI